MTFLELCKALRREAGISGSGPSSVLNQSGEMDRVINWIGQAWTQIQQKHKNWMWMRGSFSFETTANDHDYTPAEAGIDERFRMWDRNTLSCYKTSIGVANEYYLGWFPYNDYLRVYLTGTQSANPPTLFSIGPDLKLLLGPKPDDAYTIHGEYWKSPQTLTADDDEPDLPEEFHMLIVFWALEKYGLYEAASEVLVRAQKEIKYYLTALEDNQLPPIELPEPLC